MVGRPRHGHERAIAPDGRGADPNDMQLASLAPDLAVGLRPQARVSVDISRLRPFVVRTGPPISWRLSGDPAARIWLARAKCGGSAVGLRNRRSQVRILSGGFAVVPNPAYGAGLRLARPPTDALASPRFAVPFPLVVAAPMQRSERVAACDATKRCGSVASSAAADGRRHRVGRTGLDRATDHRSGERRPESVRVDRRRRCRTGGGRRARGPVRRVRRDGSSPSPRDGRSVGRRGGGGRRGCPRP